MLHSTLNFVPGNIWLLSHRCYNGESLLRSSVERRRWLYWLFQARRSYGLSVLNYVVLPNEVRLLVMDRGRGEIRCSMHRVAECMAQEYNQKQNRRTPFWESGLQATMVNTARRPLHEYLTEMDMTAVEKQLVSHPFRWQQSGYYELQNPPARARRIDFLTLQRLLNPLDFSQLQYRRHQWVNKALMQKGASATTKHVNKRPHQTFSPIGRSIRPASFNTAQTNDVKERPRQLVPKRHVT